LWIGEKRERAHRISYQLFKGDLGDGVVCHICDVPACINPDHLFLGTQQDNMDDKTQKGRQAKGETAGNSKLIESQIIAIKGDRRPQKEICAEYAICRETVRRIKRGLTWAHV
jgi:hypothetical protein